MRPLDSPSRSPRPTAGADGAPTMGHRAASRSLGTSSPSPLRILPCRPALAQPVGLPLHEEGNVPEQRDQPTGQERLLLDGDRAKRLQHPVRCIRREVVLAELPEKAGARGPLRLQKLNLRIVRHRQGPRMNYRIGSASRRPASDDRATRNTGSISRRPGGAGGDAPAAKRIGNSYAAPHPRLFISCCRKLGRRATGGSCGALARGRAALRERTQRAARRATRRWGSTGPAHSASMVSRRPRASIRAIRSGRRDSSAGPASAPPPAQRPRTPKAGSQR
jgi:hypothetical protein